MNVIQFKCLASFLYIWKELETESRKHYYMPDGHEYIET